MKQYGLNELRSKYLTFFETKHHLKMKSFSLVPQNDKSLLLINAGMAPLKPYFTGQEIPPSKRITTCQKCIRTGDIENVGKTSRHGTFFEMLGNFSFGDYFKKEAIEWAWEFVTEELKIPKEKLYVSVYEEDDEAEEIWHKNIGLPLNKIYRMGKKDNFWEHGVGPCGPCSELYVDRGEKYGCNNKECQVGCECDRYVEIWNLVFTQFEKDDNGNYNLLSNPNIDTGMGLERLAAIMQNVDSIFDVDTIKELRDEVCRISKVTYNKDTKKDVSIRLITDHIRSVTFMIVDGILPSNEGRGYVLRRLLRRAARHGKLLNIEGDFLANLSRTVIKVSKDAYIELEQKKDYIFKVISNEEERFSETIDQGLAILTGYIEQMKKEKTQQLNGQLAFKLYDTFGFPLDLTKEILEENNMTIDETGFNKEMEQQRERARSARDEMNYMGAAETIYNKLDTSMTTEFVGYDNKTYESKIVALTTEEAIVDVLNKGQRGTIFVGKTPFYSTSGGQVNDIGNIESNNSVFVVEDVIKIVGNKIGHIGYMKKGTIKNGEKVVLNINKEIRQDTAKNHSATHLLHKALKNVLGTHVEQAGSNVSSDRLRFDFTHFQSLSNKELKAVEFEVNQKIFESLQVDTKIMSIEKARNEGAMALFGEKYGDEVRVVTMGDYSKELCGGTHVSNTSNINTFKIISESGVAAGVRRIEALTSSKALEYYNEVDLTLKEISNIIKIEPSMIVKKINTILEDIKNLQQENNKLKNKLAQSSVETLIKNMETINNINVISVKVDNSNMNDLRNLGDQIKQKIQSGIIVLATTIDNKVNLLVMITDDIIKIGGHAGKLIKEIAQIVGGGGGGRPNIAQAGGKYSDKINEALEKAKEYIQQHISN